MAQLEFEIIEQYFKNSGLGFETAGVDLGIGDDCALLSVAPDQQLAMSMDILQEGVHFPANAIADLIARRALAVNLSDLAAMGAKPLCFTLGLSLPSADPAWLKSFSQGLLETAIEYQCPLVGGDMNQGNLYLTIAVQGLVPKGQAILRSGAKPGHLIYVTGTLGDGAAALSIVDTNATTNLASSNEVMVDKNKLSAKQRKFYLNAFYNPQARIDVGIALRGMASAAIDLSDGLLGDVCHIIKASGVGAEIDIELVPLSAAMKSCVKPDHQQRLALSGGDDYELCFTVPPEQCAMVEQTLSRLQVRVTRIGEIVSGDSIRCLNRLGDVVAVDGQGYSHFSRQFS